MFVGVCAKNLIYTHPIVLFLTFSLELLLESGFLAKSEHVFLLFSFKLVLFSSNFFDLDANFFDNRPFLVF